MRWGGEEWIEERFDRLEDDTRAGLLDGWVRYGHEVVALEGIAEEPLAEGGPEITA